MEEVLTKKDIDLGFRIYITECFGYMSKGIEGDDFKQIKCAEMTNDFIEVD